jgi:hypothetical protein
VNNVLSKSIIINLFAGPCGGKSVIAAGVFSLLKMHGINTELVTEVAKELSWENRLEAIRDQYSVWANQRYRIQRLINKVDIIITDSPLILSNIYGKNISDQFYNMVINDFKKYNNTNFLINRLDDHFSKIGRIHNYEESINKDKEIKKLLDDQQINYELINNNFDGINTVTKRVLKNFFHKELKICMTYKGGKNG